MSIVKKCTDWADAHDQSQLSGFALQLARVLDDDASRRTWAFVDVRAEFESRAREEETDTPWFAVGRFLSTIAYLIPVGIAWWHLKSAFGAYRVAVQSLTGVESINFLTFWTGGYDKAGLTYTGTTAGETARDVVFGLVVILLINLVVDSLSQFSVLRHKRAMSELSEIVTEVIVELVKSRSITPEDLTEILRRATLDLEGGLEKVSGLASAMSESSEALRSATDGLRETIRPLAELGVTVENAEKVLSLVGPAVASAQEAFVRSTTGAGAYLEGIIKTVKDVQVALGESRTTFDGFVDASAKMLENGASQAREVEVLSRNLSGIVAAAAASSERMMDFGKKLHEIAVQSDSPDVQAFMAALDVYSGELQQVSTEMSLAAKRVGDAVSHVSNQLQSFFGPEAQLAPEAE